MRAEDIVGLGFFAVVLVGIGLIVYGLRQPKGTHERNRLQGSGLLTVALALVAFGALTIYFIRTSARPVIEGNVWAVANGGVRLRGSSFNVTGKSGEVATIRSAYDGPGLRDGDRARVRYVEYNRRLIEFTALDGSYAGWHFEEPAGERSAAEFAALGLLVGFAAWWLLA